MTKFEKACEMSLNDWGNSFPDIIPEAEYTKRHAKWLNNLFNKMRDNKYHKFTTKTVRLIIAAAIIATLLFTAFAIPSSREYIIENFGIFGTYKLTEANNNSVNGKIKFGYIPEGFELTDEVYNSKFAHITFNHSNDSTIDIIKQSSTIEMKFNTENMDVHEVNINNTIYVCNISLTGYNSVIWNKSDYIYIISSPLPEKELLKIAQTVE